MSPLYFITLAISVAMARDVIIASKTPLQMQGETIGFTYHAPEGHRVFAVSPSFSFDFPYRLVVFNPSGNLVERSRALTIERAVDLMRSVNHLPLGEMPECHALLALAPIGPAVLRVRLSEDYESFEVLK